MATREPSTRPSSPEARGGCAASRVLVAGGPSRSPADRRRLERCCCDSPCPGVFSLGMSGMILPPLSPRNLTWGHRAFPLVYRPPALLDARHEGDPDVSFAAGPERAAWRHDDALFHEAKGVGFVPIGYSDPQVEARVGMQIFQSRSLEELGEQRAFLAEDAPSLLDMGVIGPGRGRGVLDEGLGRDA